MKKNIYKCIFAFLFCFLCTLTISTISKAAINLRINNTATRYKGKQLNYYIDNKKINLDNTKGIILNSTALVSYKDVFKKGCGAKTTYNSSTNKLTISANGVTVKLKLNSNYGYINGKKKKLKQAPVKIKYNKKNKTKILVPARFVAEALGYSYRYDSDTARISVTSPFVLKYNDSWHIYKKYYGGLIFNNSTIDMTSKPILSIGGCTMIPAKYVYSDIMGLKYSYDSSTGSIIIGDDTNNIILSIGSTNAVVNSSTILTLKTAPVIVKRKDTGESCVMVPAAAVTNALNHIYSWNKTLSVATIHTKTYFNWESQSINYDSTTFKNSINSMRGDYDQNSKNIIFTVNFSNPITSDNLVVTEDTINKTLLFSIASTYSLVNDQKCNIKSPNFNSISINNIPDNSANILIQLNGKVNYYYSMTGNVLKIYASEEIGSNYSLRFSKPDEVAFTSITNTDKYYNNQFVIIIPGNYVEYYKSNPIICNSSSILSTNVKLNIEGNTEITVTTNTIQGYKITNLGTDIGVIVDDPSKVYDNIVILDAGHGGKEAPGAQSNGYNESNINLSIIYNYAKQYFESPDSPVKAYWTRTDDTFKTLDERAKLAGKYGADLFVSLHMNSSTNTSAKGTEIFYCTANNSANSFGLTSYKLASLCLDNILPAIGTNSRGLKTANYYVIKYNTVPAVLIELGFISNTTDRGIITNSTKQKNAANAIYSAVVAAFSK